MTRAERISVGLRRHHAAHPLTAPGLARMRAASKPGECICCGDPAVPRSSKPHATQRRHERGSSDWQDTCGSKECRTAWFRYWRRDQRRAERQEVRP